MPKAVSAADITLQASNYSSIDGVAPLDNKQAPGYDNSYSNGIIRSFDTIVLPVNIQFNSTNSNNYTVNFKITGWIDNGVTKAANGNGVANAEFDPSRGGTLNMTASTPQSASTISYNASVTTGGSNNGQWRQNININVLGAANNTRLTPHLHVTVTSVTDANGKSVSDPSNLISQDLTPASSVPQYFTVSSQVSLNSYISSNTLILGDDTKADGGFNDYVGASTNPLKANVGGFSYAIGLKPLAGRSNFLGAAFPAPGDPITLTLSQNSTMNPSNPATGTTMTNAAVDLLQYGYVSNGVSSPLTPVASYGTRYPNMPTANLSDLGVPTSKRSLEANPSASLRKYAYDSGDLTGSNTDADPVPTIPNEIRLTFNNWSSDGGFPTSSGTGTTASEPFITKLGAFLTGVGTVILPLSTYSPSDNLNYNLTATTVSYTENGKAYSFDSDSNDSLGNMNQINNSANFLVTNNYHAGTPKSNTSYRLADGYQLASAYSFLGTDWWGVNADGSTFINQPYDTYVESQADTAFHQNAVGGMDTIAWWNPDAVKITGPAWTFFGNSPSGVTPVEGSNLFFYYGVAKTGGYSLPEMEKRSFDNFTWYPDLATAQAKGTVSAVKCAITSSVSYNSDSQLWIPMQAIAKDTGTQNQNGEPYVTFSRMRAFYAPHNIVSDPEDNASKYLPEDSTRSQDGLNTNIPNGALSYTPASYSNGVFTNHSSNGKDGNTANFGSTLLINNYLVRFSKITDNNGDDSSKLPPSFNVPSKYYSANSSANISIGALIEGDASVIPKSGPITIKATLPKGVTYTPDSASTALGTPAISNAGTSTVLTWTLKSTDLTGNSKNSYQTSLPDLTFNVGFSQLDLTFDGNGNATEDLQFEISSPDDQTRDIFNTSPKMTPPVSALRQDSLLIGITKSNIVASSKLSSDPNGAFSALGPVVDRNQPFAYHIRFRNDTASADSVNVLDELPQPDDGSSKFSDSYAVTSIAADLKDQASAIWYTTSSLYNAKPSWVQSIIKGLSAQPNTIYNNGSPGAEWQAYASDTQLTRYEQAHGPVTAILVHESNLALGNIQLFTYTLQPNSNLGNASGDIYSNQAVVEDSNNVILPTSSANISVIDRQISGNVFNDTNKDGLITDNNNKQEPGIEGIHVHLWDTSTTTPKLVTTNRDNQDLTKITTDKYGNYTISHLPAGTYAVGFDIGDMQDKGLLPTTMLANSSLASQSSELDPSRIAKETDGTTTYDDALTHDDYTLKSIQDLNGATQDYVDNVNAGMIGDDYHYLGFTHVPDLNFGVHPLPSVYDSYTNKNGDNEIRMVDNRSASGDKNASFYGPYDIAAKLTNFVDIANSQAVWPNASISFHGSDNNGFSFLTNTAVTPDLTSHGITGTTVFAGTDPVPLFQHDATISPKMQLDFSSINLNVLPGTANINRSTYTATLNYSLTRGPQ